MNKKALSVSLVAALGLALALLTLATLSASADRGSATYQYILGEEPVEGPDVAMADNGDTITITGTGTLSIHPKSVSGEGTFVHQDAAGNIIGEGTWTATQLVSFHSYGCDPVFTDLCGGLALIRVHLTSTSGLEFDGILQADCLVGSPPAGAKEGIRLDIQDFLNFNREVSGQTLYILQ